MTQTRQEKPKTKPPHFATLLLMALAPEEIGQRIEQRRKDLGWTHEKLAREMHVGLRTVQRWQKGRDPKTGKSWLPRLGTLMELADAMKVERSFFVEGREDQPDVADRLVTLEERVAEMDKHTARSLESLERAIDELIARLPRPQLGEEGG